MAYEFIRNDAFDARDAFDYTDRDGDGKADPDVLRRHQYGFTIGGPIRTRPRRSQLFERSCRSVRGSPR